MIEPAEPSEVIARLPVVAISGPTAAGKSGLAMALCQALPEGGEIVSVDSAQIYRGMDIGSAKPDLEAQARVRHHLIDILDPAEPYSAARFADDAQAAIADIRQRGRIPVLVGGTLLYHRALFEGLNDLPPADAALRLELESERQRIGVEAQHARLAEVDSVTAARLHPNDSQRVQRALEIHALSGRPASAWHAEPTAGAGVPGTVLRFAVMPPEKAQFDARIAARFQQMIEAGFVDEVARLRARGDLHLDLPSMRAVGYRQIWSHLDGDYSLAEAVKRGVIATRQFAKRQMTWLRSDRSWTRLEIDEDKQEPVALAGVLNAVGSSQTLGKR
ncbi:tRNA (adenosine(37)-N6)-dimethylallyltransferase MiaA [uncultured Nevskia sp.]|uniref:tRNA (adenosine(37)-N6)-dimethylallyltransferase MiaA n=1 Tax=uncultured Nevskia sp. TaxID=228950 RepID=UPI0025F9B7A3|nr:tRNA (adenosine(37)-N6)-dimethylallyltransferase MiaA [uncultured Nevskia sp.]